MPEAQLSTFRLSFTYDDPEDQNEPKKRKEIEFLANNMKQVDGQSLNQALYKMAAHREI